MKLTEFENPFTGKKDSITDISGLWGKILGVVMLFVIFAAGQNVAGMISKKLPMVDTTIEPLTQQQAAKAAPAKRIA